MFALDETITFTEMFQEMGQVGIVSLEIINATIWPSGKYTPWIRGHVSILV